MTQLPDCPIKITQFPDYPITRFGLLDRLPPRPQRLLRLHEVLHVALQLELVVARLRRRRRRRWLVGRNRHVPVVLEPGPRRNLEARAVDDRIALASFRTRRGAMPFVLVNSVIQPNLLLRYTADNQTSTSWPAKSSSPRSNSVC